MKTAKEIAQWIVDVRKTNMSDCELYYEVVTMIEELNKDVESCFTCKHNRLNILCYKPNCKNMSNWEQK